QAPPVSAHHRADASADPTPCRRPAPPAALSAPSTPQRHRSAHWHRARRVLATTYLGGLGGRLGALPLGAEYDGRAHGVPVLAVPPQDMSQRCAGGGQLVHTS